MKISLLSLSLLGSLGLAGTAIAADLPAPAAAPIPAVVGFLFPPVIAQLGPTTPYSTINCAEFAKLPDGTWQSIGTHRFGLGFVQNIVPPVRPIRVGGFIYNNIDLWSQLETQCESTLVRARY